MESKDGGWQGRCRRRYENVFYLAAASYEEDAEKARIYALSADSATYVIFD